MELYYLLLESIPFQLHKCVQFQAIPLKHGNVLTENLFSFRCPVFFWYKRKKKGIFFYNQYHVCCCWVWKMFGRSDDDKQGKEIIRTFWFCIWCCDELSLSGLEIVSPFNEIPESIGPSIDCGRELDPSIWN